MGAYNVAYGNRSNVIGTYSRAMGSNSVAIGSGVQSLSDGSIAIGKGSGYEFEDASRSAKSTDRDYYGRDWELPPEYKVLKQVLRTDIADDKTDTRTSSRKNGYFEHGDQPKYNNYGAGSSDPGGFIVEGKNALGIGTYTQVRGDSAIGLATGEMTADLSDKDKSAYARDMRKIMDMEETLYEAKEKLKAEANNGDKKALESAVQAAEESLATAKKNFRETYLKKYSFVDGNGALGVGRQILAQGDRSMAVGDYAKAISSDAIAYGGQTLANGTNSMAMGGKAHVGTEETGFNNSMAIGSHTNVQAGNAVALGAFSQVTGTNSLALGFGTQSSTDSNNITYNSVSGHDSTLIGSYGNIAGNNSILIGSSGSIANDRVVGLGNNINIAAADSDDQENNTAGSVFLGDHAGYVKDSKRARSLGEVTLVGSDKKKELTESLSSTKGALRDYTKDFIYIYMLENQDDGTKIGAPIAVRSDFAGGDSTVGVVSVGSTYEQTFENLDKIKEHHKKVGSLITVPVEVTVQVTKNGISLGKQQQTRYFAADATQEQINSDSTLSDEDKKKVWNTIQESRKKADTKYTVFETRRIQNVAPGLIGSNSTDAINGSQLFATNQMLGNLVGSLKKTFGDNVTITEDGQIKVSGGTLGWIAKAKAADGSNGTVNYQVGKDDKITKDDLEKKGSAIEAADQLVFQAGKNIGLVQTPDTLTISTIDTPSFKSVELRGETKEVNGSQETPVTMVDSSGMQVYTETVTGSTTTKKVSTTVNNKGVTTDGTVKVTNGKNGDQAKEFVTIDKGTDGSGTDKEYGKIGLDGKKGSNATITIDRGTKSLNDDVNIGVDPSQPVSETNKSATMDRITYTTTGSNKTVINHEVATMDDGLFLTTSKDVTDNKAAAKVKLNNTIKFTDGANTKVSTVESKDGVHELHIDVTGLPMTYTVSQTGGTDAPVSVSKVGDTYQLADGTKLVKVGDKFYKPSQLVDPNADQPQVKPEEVAKDWTVNDSISLVNKDGSNNAPTTLKNVGSGLKDANGNSTTLDQAVGSNAVNVDDLRTLGKAATTEVTGTGAAEVTKVTGANGQNIYNVHVERFMQVAETDVEGNKVVKAADNHYYKEADIKDKTYIDGQWYNNTDIEDKTKIGDKWYNADDVVNGVPKPNATELTVQATTAPNKAVGLQNNLVNPNDNTPTRLSNLASALSGEVGNGANTEDNSAINGIDKNGKPTSESGNNTFVKNVLDLDATEKTVEQLKTSLGHEPSEDEVKAEKARAEKDKALLNSAVTVTDLQKTLQSPLFFEGDSADGVANENDSDKNTFARKLSQKTKIVGGVDLGLKENATADERKKAIAEKLTDHNIGVISNGTDTLTIKLAKDLTDLHSVTTTDDKGNTTQINGKGLATTADDGKGNIKITTVTSDGITIVTTDKDGNNNVSLTNKGLDNGHHQIINVKSGLLDRQGKPVTLKNASGDILNNAVNVKDLRDVVQGLTDSGKGGGFGLTGNNGEVRKSLGETITLKGGIANKIENGIDMNKPEKATTDKNTYIDVKTSKNGSEKIMVVEIAKDLTDLNSAEFTDQEGNTTKMKGDGIYIDKNGDGNADISLTSEGLNNGGNKITNVADGTEDTDAVNVSQLNKLKQEIKQNIGDEINELNAYAPVVYTDKNGNRVIRKGNKFVKKNDETVEILPQDIRLSLVNADGKTTNPSTLQNVAEGVQDTDAVNVKQLTDATGKPLTFNGDAGSSSAKLGETVAIKGGANSADLTDNNIGVIADSTTKTLNVKLSKKLKGLESAEFVDNNGNTTNITGDGVHISGGNGSNVSLTSQGLNNGGNRITNIAPGVEATDAVNVSQLNQVGAALHNRINNVAKGAYGGVASAGAMASLPQAYLPGKSMVAAGASHYRGESAVALGTSRISDNGKIILKLNASHNTSGNTMVGAGVGYQF
ncbi:YadA-like family protein [Gallibacterium anatis]|uniref:YadA-like family protein n=1 Tax=Gallibacterium anatis TaxID=750 RepID=UPI00036661A4|nr:YadA-like family protein [Gallibacterium anatis]KGQ58910.1 hypothetical protein IE01_00710 [Gallibacterium anatis DSM 16844 = F 149]